METSLEDAREFAALEAAGRSIRERAQALLGSYATSLEEDERILEALRECAWEEASPGVKNERFWFCGDEAGERGRQYQVLVAFRKGKKDILKELTRCCEWSCT